MNRGKSGNSSFLALFLSAILIAAGLYMTITHSVEWITGYFSVEEMEPLQTESAQATNEGSTVKKDQPLYPSAPIQGEQLGHLHIPKLNASIPIYEGADEDELSKGIGHFADSVLPGESNNSVLSGHRDTVFRRLGEVGTDDLLVVTTSAGEFTYRVKKVRIVDADDRTVIVPKPEATLTVTTCYPFTFIGNAPKRYVLVADLIDSRLLQTS